MDRIVNTELILSPANWIIINLVGALLALSIAVILPTIHTNKDAK